MNRYNNLNGFRAFCAIGIALMHILANISPTPHLHNKGCKLNCVSKE